MANNFSDEAMAEQRQVESDLAKMSETYREILQSGIISEDSSAPCERLHINTSAATMVGLLCIVRHYYNPIVCEF